MTKKNSIHDYIDSLPNDLWIKLRDQTHRNLSIVDEDEARIIKFVLLHDTRSLSAVITEEHLQVNISVDRVSKLSSMLRKSLDIIGSIPIEIRFAGQTFREEDTLSSLGAFYPDKVYFGLNLSSAVGPGVSKLKEWDKYFVDLTKFMMNSPESYSVLCSDIQQLIEKSEDEDFNSEQLWRRMVLLRNLPGILVNKMPIKSLQTCISELVSCIDSFYKPENSQYIYQIVNTLEWLTYICPSALDSSVIGNMVRKGFVQQIERIIKDDNLPISLRTEAAWTFGWAGIACPYIGPETLPTLNNREREEKNLLLRQVFRAAGLRVGHFRSAYWWASVSREAGSFIPPSRDHGVSIGAITNPEETHEMLKLFAKMALQVDQIQNQVDQIKKEETRENCKLTLGLAQQQPITLALRGTVRFEGQTLNPLNLNSESISIYERLAADAPNIDKWRIHAKDIGQKLYDHVFLEHPAALRCHFLGLGSVVNNDKNLGIEFKSSSELLRLPMEFIYMNDFLVLKHSLTRFITGMYCARRPISGKEIEKYKNGSPYKLHILLVASDTGGLSNVDNEITSLDESLRDFLSSHGIKFEITTILTADASYERIRTELANSKYEIFHYAGHGSYDKTSPDNSSLYFWEQKNRNGNRIAMSANELGIGLNGTNLRFVYLSCCSSAAHADLSAAVDDDFMGIMDALIKNSIPSVLGFRWPVSDIGAKMLAVEFYRSFLSQGDLGIALLNARRRVAEFSKNDFSWISPVLVIQE